MANIKQDTKHLSLFLKDKAVSGDLVIRDKSTLDKGDSRGIEENL